MKKLILIMMLLFITPFIYSQYESNFTGAEVDAGITKANKILLSNTTVNLNSTMTSADIQALIDAQPKNLGGYTLIFQFADGTYTLNATLNFTGFYAGTLTVQGNTSEATSKHTTQAVYLNFNNNTTGFNYNFNTAVVIIKWLKIQVVSNTNARNCIFANGSTKFVVQYCYLLGNSTSNGAGVNATYTPIVDIYECYMYILTYAIYCGVIPLCQSNSNSITAPATAVGLCSDAGSQIVKSGVQPAGTTPEVTANGGLIR